MYLWGVGGGGGGGGWLGLELTDILHSAIRALHITSDSIQTCSFISHRLEICTMTKREYKRICQGIALDT